MIYSSKNQNDELCRPSLSVEERLLLIGCDESAKRLKIVDVCFFPITYQFCCSRLIRRVCQLYLVQLRHQQCTWHEHNVCFVRELNSVQVSRLFLSHHNLHLSKINKQAILTAMRGKYTSIRY